jgi:RNase P subunit RPR2
MDSKESFYCRPCKGYVVGEKIEKVTNFQDENTMLEATCTKCGSTLRKVVRAAAQ